MKKVVIQCFAASENDGDFSYSAEVLPDSYERAELDGFRVVQIPEDKAKEWKEFLNKKREWSNYWENLDNKF